MGDSMIYYCLYVIISLIIRNIRYLVFFMGDTVIA